MNFRARLKRTLDLALAGGGLLIMSPLMAIISAAIAIESPGGVFFIQERIGKDGKVFRLFKFRTMKSAPMRYNPDGSTRVDPDDDRVTTIGRGLRGSLDELPQLWNVIRGDMSIVGPRPELATQRHLYTTEEERKLMMLPGITSLAIVLGRTELPWKERVAIDIQYVDQWSLSLDLKIIVQTLIMPFGWKPFKFHRANPWRT